MDFYDKLVVSITLVIVTIFCVCSNLVFAASVPYTVSTGLRVQDDTIVSSDTSKYLYFRVSPGVTYTLKSNRQSGTYGIAFLNEEPKVGLVVSDIRYLGAGSSLDISYDNSTYLFIFGWSATSDDFESLTVTYDSSFSNVIKQLSVTVSPSDLWSIFGSSVPYIFVVILVGFGFYLVFRAIRGVSKGRSNI